MTPEQMSRNHHNRLAYWLHFRPTTVATVIMVVVLVPVWWLTGEWSPLP